MSAEYIESEREKRNPIIRIADKLIRILGNKMDKESNGHVVKKQLRCAISSCFDKNNICCKTCDIKKCRYKCNFIDKEVCEHQKWD